MSVNEYTRISRFQEIRPCDHPILGRQLIIASNYNRGSVCLFVCMFVCGHVNVFLLDGFYLGR